MARNQVTGKGNYNTICDECGLKFKASALRRRWDGAMVDSACFESRHPQEFIRAKKDSKVLSYIRTDTDGVDVSPVLNCAGLTFQDISAAGLNSLLGDDLTVYKMRVVPTGTITVPAGTTLTVLCELTI
jgi:hypothetical protein